MCPRRRRHPLRLAVARGEGEASGAATVLTGLSREEHGLYDAGVRFLASEHTTIAERLLRAGYRTAAFVTSPRMNRSRRLDQGFEVYDDQLAAPERSTSAQSVALAERVHSWWTSQDAPRFAWIHLSKAESGQPEDAVAELDRLVSRLSALLDRANEGPGSCLRRRAGPPNRTASRTPWESPGGRTACRCFGAHPLRPSGPFPPRQRTAR